MNIEDLKQFSVLARTEHMGQAADELALSTSAVSKMLQRLEDEIRIPLFDRVGRSLKLNQDGERLLQRCVPLLHEFHQLESEFSVYSGAVRCRLAGPALLQLKWGGLLSKALSSIYPEAQFHFGNQDECSALLALEQGEVDAALVTSAITPESVAGYESCTLGHISWAIASGAKHPLQKGFGALELDTVLSYPFVVPHQAHFQVLNSGFATDGWRDDLYPRRILYRSDDLLLVDGLVRRNMALAYLPEYVLAELGLHAVELEQNLQQHELDVCLWYRPSRSLGWLNRCLSELQKSEVIS